MYWIEYLTFSDLVTRHNERRRRREREEAGKQQGKIQNKNNFHKDFFFLKSYSRETKLEKDPLKLLLYTKNMKGESMWEMPDSNMGPLPQKSVAFPMSHHISF